MLTLILPFSRSGADSFSAHARIPTFAGTRPDSAMFRYSHSFYHFSVLVRTVFRHSHGFHLLLVVAGFNNFLALTLNLPFFGTGPDSFSALARIPPFAGSRPIQQFCGAHTDSTIFRTGPDSFSALARIPPFAGSRPDSTIDRKSVV